MKKMEWFSKLSNEDRNHKAMLTKNKYKVFGKKDDFEVWQKFFEQNDLFTSKFFGTTTTEGSTLCAAVRPQAERHCPMGSVGPPRRPHGAPHGAPWGPMGPPGAPTGPGVKDWQNF